MLAASEGYFGSSTGGRGLPMSIDDCLRARKQLGVDRTVEIQVDTAPQNMIMEAAKFVTSATFSLQTGLVVVDPR